MLRFILPIFLFSSLFAQVAKAPELERNGKYKEALKIYGQERKAKKNDNLYALEVFRLYVLMKKEKAAKVELNKIPKGEWRNLANFCRENGLFHLAKEIESSLFPEATPYQEAKVFLKEGKIKEGIRKISTLPESEKKYYYLAKLLFLSGEFDSALRYTFELARKFPNSNFRNQLYELNLLPSFIPDINPLLSALISLECEENKKTEEMLKKIDHPYAKILLSSLYFEEKKTDLAVKLLEEIIYKDTTAFFASKALLSLAQIYLALNDKERANSILEDLITRYPSSPFTPIARSQLKLEKRGGIY